MSRPPAGKGIVIPRPDFQPYGSYPPGGTVADFDVPFRPKPWVNPKIGNVKGRKGMMPMALQENRYREMVYWQDEIRRAARAAMGGRLAYEGPVDVWWDFYVCPTPHHPDRDNILKCSDDALQADRYTGVGVIVNDGQIRGGEPRLHLGPYVEGARCVVVAL